MVCMSKRRRSPALDGAGSPTNGLAPVRSAARVWSATLFRAAGAGSDTLRRGTVPVWRTGGATPYRYDNTSPLIKRVHPSSITNSSSLKGKEMVVGAIIDMPSASSTVATMRSTTTKTR